LARDILDHQLVDTDEIQVIRAADSVPGPGGRRPHHPPRRRGRQACRHCCAGWARNGFRWQSDPGTGVIDWAAIESFGSDCRRGHRRPAERCGAPHSAPAQAAPRRKLGGTWLKGWAGRPGRELIESLARSAAGRAGGDWKPQELHAPAARGRTRPRPRAHRQDGTGMRRWTRCVEPE